MKKLVLLPTPEKLEYLDGIFKFTQSGYIVIEDRTIFTSAKRLKSFIFDALHKENSIIIRGENYQNQIVRFIQKLSLSNQEYELVIEQDGIFIYYNQPEGAFYAVSTLKQIITSCDNNLPCLHISDKPVYKTRGLMLDISRCKVPTMDTLYKIVDMLADLKINQLQLYVEGFSFAYPSLKKYWENITPITGEEIMELDRYCKDNYIDLVPNQNTFGHMEPWLMQEEFRTLAECPDGFTFQDCFIKNPRCLNPLDQKSIEFIKTLTDDMLGYFTSKYYNVCCDETLELGQGKSKELVDKVGLGRVYLDYLLKINEIVKSNGKKMMFWGDIIKEYPELIKELPEDIIALEWGYNPDQPSDESCEKFKNAGVPYFVCPGTASWNSVLGKTDQMIKNITRAAVTGIKFGAIGLLNTDWGDDGHWHPLPVSYAGYAFGAAMSWGPDNNQSIENLEDYLNVHVFKDRNMVMGKFVLEAGNYYLHEEKYINNITQIVQLLYNSFDNLNVVSDTTIEGFQNVIDYLDEKCKMLKCSDMQCEDASLIFNEYSTAIRLVSHGAKAGIFKSSDENYKKSKAKELKEEIEHIIFDLKAVWLKRNKTSRMAESLQRLEDFKMGYGRSI